MESKVYSQRKRKMTNNYPNSLINLLSPEQRKVFLTLLNKKNSTSLDLLKELNKLISSFGGFFSEQKSYKQILEKICEKKGIKNMRSNSVYEIEQLILENKFNAIYNSLNEEDKKKFDQEIQKIALQRGLSTDQAKSISAIGTLAGANLAGFGLYIMASTVVGGITSAIGLTLPFAVYTGMSSVLSVITGPVGWIAGLGYLAYTFRNDNLESAQNKLKGSFEAIKGLVMGNLEHSEIIVSQICSYRILLLKENETKLEENKLQLKSVEEKLSTSKELKNNLQNQIKGLNYHLSEVNNELSKLNEKSTSLTQEIMLNELKIKQLK